MTLDPDSPEELVAQALSVLKGLEAAIKEHPGSPFLEPYRTALKTVRDHDPAEWTRMKLLIKKAGVGIRDLKNGLQDAAESGCRNGAADPVRAGEMLPDSPAPDLLIPPPYYLLPEGTAQTLVNKNGVQYEFIVAHAPIVIAGRLNDTDENTQYLRLAWKRGEKWHEITVDRGKLMSASKIVELASQGFPVADTTAKAVVSYLNDLEALNYGQIPCASVSSHLGWQGRHGDQGFLWGPALLLPDGTGQLVTNLDGLPPNQWPENGVAFHGLGPGDDQIARGFRAGGTFEGWTQAVEVLKEHPRALLGLYAAFIPPLQEIIGAPNFGADWAHRTSVGKTTVLRVGASVWGNADERHPDSVIHSRDATKVWVERGCAVQTGLPLFLDDTKRTRHPDQISQVIYAVANGQGRGRGNTRSLAQTRTWHTVLLSSGEAPATSHSQDGGSRMRCLEIRGLPFGEVSGAACQLVDHLNSSLLRHFGHAGPRFVLWLLKHRDRWDQYREIYLHAVDELAKLGDDPAAGRLAAYGAAIEVAASMVHDALHLPWAYPDTVRTLWAAIVAEASDAAGDHRALLDVMSVANSRQEAFDGRAEDVRGVAKVPAGGWLGRWDQGEAWQWISFFPTQLKRILEEQKYDPEAILASWQERGWLDCELGRRTKSIRVGHGHTHLIVIRREAVDEVERGHRGRTGDGSGDTREDDQ